MEFLHYFVTSCLLGPNILLSNLSSNKIYFLTPVWETKFHSRKQTTGKNTVLYVLIIRFLDRKQRAVIAQSV
jgi:hypothetical protein